MVLKLKITMVIPRDRERAEREKKNMVIEVACADTMKRNDGIINKSSSNRSKRKQWPENYTIRVCYSSYLYPIHLHTQKRKKTVEHSGSTFCNKKT